MAHRSGAFIERSFSKSKDSKMEIKRSGSRPSARGAAEYFTGSVRIDPLFEAPDPARARHGTLIRSDRP
jgi:hypothetical protein